MARSLLCIFALSLLAACGSSQAGAAGTTPAAGPSTGTAGEIDNARLEEAERLFRQGIELTSARRCTEAIQTSLLPAIAAYRDAFAPVGQVAAARTQSGAMRSMISNMLGAGPSSGIVVGPNYPDAYYYLAFCHVELGQVREAFDALQSALAIMPDDFVYLAELGHVYQSVSQWEDALATFRSAHAGVRHRLESGASLADIVMGEPMSFWSARTRRGVGFALIELERLDEAEAVYREILAEFPDDAQSQNEMRYIAELRGR